MEISIVLEDFILESVCENRLQYSGLPAYDRRIIRLCPFKGKCFVCSTLFPKWHREDESKGSHNIFKVHPCDYYGKGYVRRRMKEMFPKLY